MSGITVEGFGALGSMGNVAAFFSMLAAVSAISLTAFISYRIRDDVRGMEEFKARLAIVEKELNESVFVSDEIVNVLYDLFNISSTLMAVNDLRHGGYENSPALDEDLASQLEVIEKHFAELGLFSRDEVRRRSVQMSLSQRYGDLHTLEIMQRIKDGEVGVKDAGIVQSYTHLRARLMRGSAVTFDPAAWTGRPSGGSF